MLNMIEIEFMHDSVTPVFVGVVSEQMPVPFPPHLHFCSKSYARVLTAIIPDALSFRIVADFS